MALAQLETQHEYPLLHLSPVIGTEVGGDTLFANMEAAYDTLDEPTRATSPASS